MKIRCFRNRKKETDDIFAREIVSNINDAKKREMELWVQAAKEK